MVEEINKLMYGEEYFNKQTAFEACLTKVKEKHAKWFEERENALPESERGRPFGDYIESYKDGYKQFQVSLELPFEIQKDFGDCFEKHWGKQ